MAGVWSLPSSHGTLDIVWRRISDQTLSISFNDVTSSTENTFLTFDNETILGDPGYATLDSSTGLSFYVTVLTDACRIYRTPMSISQSAMASQQRIVVHSVEQEKHVLLQSLGKPTFLHSISASKTIVAVDDHALLGIDWSIKNGACTYIINPNVGILKPMLGSLGLGWLSGSKNASKDFALSVLSFECAADTFIAVLWASCTVEVFALHPRVTEPLLSFPVAPNDAISKAKSGKMVISTEGTDFELGGQRFTLYAFADSIEAVHTHILLVKENGVLDHTFHSSFASPVGCEFHGLVTASTSVQPSAMVLWSSQSAPPSLFLQNLTLNQPDSDVLLQHPSKLEANDSILGVAFVPSIETYALISTSHISPIRPVETYDPYETFVSSLATADALDIGLMRRVLASGDVHPSKFHEILHLIHEVAASDDDSSILSQLSRLSERDTPGLVRRQLPNLLCAVSHIPAPAEDEQAIHSTLASLFRSMGQKRAVDGELVEILRIAHQILASRILILDLLQRATAKWRSMTLVSQQNTQSTQDIRFVHSWAKSVQPALNGVMKYFRLLTILGEKNNGMGLLGLLARSYPNENQSQELMEPSSQNRLASGITTHVALAQYFLNTMLCVHIPSGGPTSSGIQLSFHRILQLGNALLDASDFDALKVFVDTTESDCPWVLHFKAFLHLQPNFEEPNAAITCFKTIADMLESTKTEDSRNIFDELVGGLQSSTGPLKASPALPIHSKYIASLAAFICGSSLSSPTTSNSFSILTSSSSSVSILDYLRGNSALLVALIPQQFDQFFVSVATTGVTASAQLDPSQSKAIFTRMLDHHLASGNWQAAYSLVFSQTDSSRRSWGIADLISKLLDHGPDGVERLYRLDLDPDMLKSAASYLWSKAECVDVRAFQPQLLLAAGAGSSSMPLPASFMSATRTINYYKVLFTLLLEHADIPSACRALYRLADRHKKESAFRIEDWEEAENCLALVISTLALLPESGQWFPYADGVPVSFQDPNLAISKRRKQDTRQIFNQGTNAMDMDNEGQNASEWEESIVSIADVRRDHMRTKAELALSMISLSKQTFQPNLTLGSTRSFLNETTSLRSLAMVTNIEDICRLLIGKAHYSMALQLCHVYDLPTSAESIFRALAEQYALAVLNSSTKNNEKATTTVAAPHLVIMENNLRGLLKDFDGRNPRDTRYYEVVLTVMLKINPECEIPIWLSTRVKHFHPNKLLRELLVHNRIEAASQIAAEYLIWRFGSENDPTQDTDLVNQPFSHLATVSGAVLDRLHELISSQVADGTPSSSCRYSQMVLDLLNPEDSILQKERV